MRRLCSKALGFLLLVVVLGGVATAQDLAGVWMSPDWYFPGDRTYSEQEVRLKARQVLGSVAKQGVTDVFLETFLRGYAICPSIEMAPNGQVLRIMDYVPGTSTHPVYPHLNWGYRTQVDTVIDPLQIFIEEGALVGVSVHAWVHLYYWRMDNTDIMLRWHNGPTIWSELMEEYLLKQAERLDLLQGRSVRPGYEAMAAESLAQTMTPDVCRGAAEIFAQGCDARKLAALLREAGFKPGNHPIGELVRQVIAAGGDRPDFLLMASDDEPFPAPRDKTLRPVYVDPAHPMVQQRLKTAFVNIAKTHRGLAGIHLDHVRYPVDGQGLSADTGVIDGSYRYYNAADSAQMEEYRTLHQALATRRENIDTLVTEIRKAIPSKLTLSAAVLPLYYRDRDTGNKFRTSGYDYGAQAWMNWPVDFVVPMMYEYHPYLIRTIIEDYQGKAEAANPSRPIQVYPGISRLAYTRNGSIKARGWVFFDLTLARDVNAPQETEDLDFGK